MIHNTGSQPVLDFLRARCDKHQMESTLRAFPSKVKPRIDLQIQVLKQKLACTQLEIDLYVCALSPGCAQGNPRNWVQHGQAHHCGGARFVFGQSHA